MKRTSFRLQPVLELRRSQERAAAQDAARAAAQAAEADRRATDYETVVSVANLPPRLDGRSFVLAMTRLRTQATDAADARALAIAHAEQADLVRLRWTEAAQRTKGLERLRERHAEKLAAAEAAAEERAADDLVTGRAGRDRFHPQEVPWTP